MILLAKDHLLNVELAQKVLGKRMLEVHALDGKFTVNDFITYDENVKHSLEVAMNAHIAKPNRHCYSISNHSKVFLNGAVC